ncbi:NAD-dependent epimerase/dehydratase family protein [Niabella drilacis]|uniref:dTDP-6-deoxy-L-talose 4-dehydrogenase (NAD+) n=1 Tax=Niabella drilacis (strain DSM 25811 / CCM 8410 / CCUG 62505 / LMG 26954 / E90) TaxID=1285928 RepID=A0A1G6ZGZ1_NIADE|nr:NAD(P)-dependent oxidoreductase [Niabella drilacis]SDE01095.1 dTDP-6-deoxy-L-talose 4-dehydrogenase (NAD+) [Niabella drilacis]
MRKVLVTGATGFIGQYVVRSLLKQDVDIIATSRHISRTGLFDHPRIRVQSFDLHQQNGERDLYAYFEQPDAVIHLAWEGLPNYKEAFHLEENLPAHKQFLSNLIKHGLGDLTVTGTCFEYGMQEGRLDETMPARPGNSYAIAKDLLRKELEKLQTEKPFCIKWTRLFYMYGAGQNSRSLLPQLDAALEAGAPVFNMSGGEQTRDFMPVTAVAEALVKVALQQEVTGIINISGNRPVTVKQFVLDHLRSKNQKIQLNLGFYPYPDFEPMHFWGDNSKLKSIK